ncbi:MAG: DEAD/DEAH box helicase [Acidimicrobiales bacterium]|nr:DEAD/DEAH box helicase [Acidimicrobiales bacterium]
MSTTFTDLGVPARLAEALADNGMTEAFEVQEATIPDALAGRDICGRAPTGSGKTIAFGVPVLARVPKAKAGRPTALILSPTRELADQIRDEMLPAAIAMNRYVTAVYGGVGYGAQTNALRKGVDVLVACPGRLLDLIDSRHVTLADVEIVVVDEADRMADMGFLPVVRKLLDQTNEKRQTLLFSATLDGDIAELTRRYQNDPARHEIGDAEPDITAMTHHFWKIEHEDRVDHSRDAIMAAGPTIVFTRTRHGADRLARQLGKAGVTADAIHGGRSQNQRTRALDSFARGRSQALIATDVAARGIHVDGVECVVHFDPPEDDKTYLHRSGRTARAGANGMVVSFVRPNNRKEVAALQRALGLPVETEAPDPSALGDGSAHRPARPESKERPSHQGGTKPRSKNNRPSHGGGGGRNQDRSSAKPGGRSGGNKQRNSNLYDPNDPRIERWESENGDRLRDDSSRGGRSTDGRGGGKPRGKSSGGKPGGRPGGGRPGGNKSGGGKSSGGGRNHRKGGRPNADRSS